jgi:hypothetical protein
MCEAEREVRVWPCSPLSELHKSQDSESIISHIRIMPTDDDPIEAEIVIEREDGSQKRDSEMEGTEDERTKAGYGPLREV